MIEFLEKNTIPLGQIRVSNCAGARTCWSQPKDTLPFLYLTGVLASRLIKLGRWPATQAGKILQS
jgi:hypothetical protein